jgi:hypothetical protein
MIRKTMPIPNVLQINIGGHGNIDFSYEFKEQLRGVFYPIDGTNPIVGKMPFFLNT